MTPKRGDRVAPPPGPAEFDLVFGTNDAAKGWIELRRVYVMVARTGHPQATE